jgi:endonuclease YncB( thermonuclease family)
MKAKALLNLLPIGAVAVVGWVYVSSQWQQSQAKRPGYDDPAAPSPVPGLVPKPQSEPADVINVHDGDTITVMQGGQKLKVRLCGIDAPELSQPLGVQSRDNLRSLIASAGNQVILYISDTDRYGRKVAELYVPAHNPQQPEEEKLLNDEQLVAGMAYVYTKYASRCPNGRGYAQMEAKAKQQRRGVWSDPTAMKPWDYRKTPR